MADGGSGTDLTGDGHDGSPFWQPIPINAYPRPKSATPIYTPLVIAYAPCMSSNRVHAAPLSSGLLQPARPGLGPADGGHAGRAT